MSKGPAGGEEQDKDLDEAAKKFEQTVGNPKAPDEE